MRASDLDALSRKEMNELETNVKDWIIDDILDANGYKSYALHLLKYNLFLTKDPTITARVFPNRGLIQLNYYLDDPKIISIKIRHELLHQILGHLLQTVKILAKDEGLDIHHLKKSDYKRLEQKAFGTVVPAEGVKGLEHWKGTKIPLANLVGDWDLSRYLAKDELELAKHDTLLGRELEHLVLELDRPDLVDLSYPELYKAVGDEIFQWQIKGKKIIRGNMKDSETFLPELVATDSDDLSEVETEYATDDTETAEDADKPKDDVAFTSEETEVKR